jgi:hypothetical protein
MMQRNPQWAASAVDALSTAHLFKCLQEIASATLPTHRLT